MKSGSLDVPWSRLVDDLRRFVQRRVADPHASDDIVQDVLTKLAARLGEQAPGGPLHPWLLSVARNAIIDHYRSRRRDHDAAPESLAAPPSHETDLERASLLHSFRAFVHALPPAQREAVLLTEYDGLTQRAVAERLGVPVSTIKSRVQRGRQRLEQALRDCCTFEFDRRGHLVDWHRRPGGACGDC